VDTRGYIDLYTKFVYTRTQTKTIKVRYLLVEANTSYNVLLGRLSLNTLGAIVSTPHLAMKFPSPTGDIITVQKTARQCYAASLRVECMRPPSAQVRSKEVRRDHVVAVTDLDPRVEEMRVEPQEETRVVSLVGEHKTT